MAAHGQNIWYIWRIFAVCFVFFISFPASARKGNEPIYTDTFDLAAGGAALTRASKDGRIYANPALLVYGGNWHRWLGLTSTMLSTPETVGTVQKIAQGGGGNNEGSESTNDFVATILDNPLHFGWLTALGYVSANFGLGVFSRFEPDVRIRQFGDYGLPQLHLQLESYHGAAGALALRSPWRWLSFGLAVKYIYALEPDVRADVADQDAVTSVQPTNLIPDPTRHYRGGGMDVGMLWFFQGRNIDWSVASKIDDLGGVAFQKGSQPAAENYVPQNFRQVVSVGFGATLHTSADAIHLAVDYRDLLDAYEDELFKKVYAGAKLMLRTYIGLAAGVYHGYPSAGIELDLLLMRLGVSTYTREFGDHPGVDPRRIVMGSISTGF